MSSDKDENKNSENAESSQQDVEEGPEADSKGSTKELLQSHVENLHQAISRMDVNRQKKFYFITIPGIIRLVQLFLSLLNIIMFGYYCTSYSDDAKNMIPPYCLSQTKEQFFMLCNYYTLMGCLAIILAGICSPFSNAALLSSLFPFVFDVIQASLIFISAFTLMHFYRTNREKIKEVMPEGSSTKVGILFLGVVLAILHVASAVYDGLIFIQYLHGYRTEQKALKKEEESMLEKMN